MEEPTGVHSPSSRGLVWAIDYSRSSSARGVPPRYAGESALPRVTSQGEFKRTGGGGGGAAAVHHGRLDATAASK